MSLFWTQILLSLSLTIQSLELLALVSRPSLHEVWSWQIIRQDFKVFPNWMLSLFDRALSTNGFRILIVLRLGLGLIFPFFPHPLVMLTLLIATILIALRWRGAFNGGSDFMTFIVLNMLTIVSLFPDQPKVLLGALWYIALQSTISYFIAGYVKVKRASWRGGKSMSIFLHTTIYESSPTLSSISANRTLCLIATWVVLFFELSFPIVFLKPEWTWIYLCLGFFFHLGNAFVFGLNRFLLAWVCTYPAIYYCTHALQSMTLKF